MQRYMELRTILFANGISHGEFAKGISRSARYVSLRMTGQAPWDMDDVYNICAFLNVKLGSKDAPAITYDEIPKYFPPRRTVGGKSSTKGVTPFSAKEVQAS